MPINDPADPARNRISDVEIADSSNGTCVAEAPPAQSVNMSLQELVKLLAQQWKTVILAVSNSDQQDSVSMTLKHGAQIDAQKLCGSLSASIQSGV